LFLRSPFGQCWEPLLAENETILFVKQDADWRINFIRDDNDRVTALQLAYQGFQFPLAQREDDDSPT